MNCNNALQKLNEEQKQYDSVEHRIIDEYARDLYFRHYRCNQKRKKFVIEHLMECKDDCLMGWSAIHRQAQSMTKPVPHQPFSSSSCPATIEILGLQNGLVTDIYNPSTPMQSSSSSSPLTSWQATWVQGVRHGVGRQAVQSGEVRYGVWREGVCEGCVVNMTPIATNVF